MQGVLYDFILLYYIQYNLHIFLLFWIINNHTLGSKNVSLIYDYIKKHVADIYLFASQFQNGRSYGRTDK